MTQRSSRFHNSSSSDSPSPNFTSQRSRSPRSTSPKSSSARRSHSSRSSSSVSCYSSSYSPRSYSPNSRSYSPSSHSPRSYSPNSGSQSSVFQMDCPSTSYSASLHSPSCQNQSGDRGSPLRRRKADSRYHLRASLRRHPKLLEAVIVNCFACICDSLREGCDVDIKDEDGYTALMVAVEIGRLEILDFLLNNGASVRARNNWGETALYLAMCQAGPSTLAIVKRLLQHDTLAANVASNSGCVPVFQVSSRFQDVELTVGIVKELVWANADLDVQGSNPDVLYGRRMTSFEMAATVGNFRVCRLLYDAGCDVRIVHEWKTRDSFPRLLRSDRKWTDDMITWVTQPRDLQQQCVITIRRIMRNNRRDVRLNSSELGLPGELVRMVNMEWLTIHYEE